MSALRIQRSWVVVFGLVGLCALVYGCNGPKMSPVGVSGQTLIGLPEERLRTCAGTPLREVAQPASTLRVYYKESPTR